MGLSGLGNRLESMASNITGNIARASITLGGYKSGGDISAFMDSDAANAIEFELPFNPTSIRLDAMAGGGHKISTSGGVNYGVIDPRIQMSFVAYVDEVNNYDAFLYERVNRGGGVVGITRTAVNVVKNKEYSVAVYVEGLLAALRSEANSEIWFNWGEMHYGGTLNSVDAKYTMFNPEGNPIKAEIAIRILCVSNQKRSLRVEWKEKYEQSIKALMQMRSGETENGVQSVDMARASALNRFISL